MKHLISERLSALESECKQAISVVPLLRDGMTDADDENRKGRVRDLTREIAHDLGQVSAGGDYQAQVPTLRQNIEDSLQVILDTPISRIRSYVLGSLRFALGMIEGFTQQSDGEGEQVQRVLTCLAGAVRESFGSDMPQDEGRTAQQISEIVGISLQKTMRLLVKLIGKLLVETPPEFQVDGQPTLYCISPEGIIHLEDAEQI